MQCMVVELIAIERCRQRNTAIALTIYVRTQANLGRLYRAQRGDSNGTLYTPITQVVVELIAIEGWELRNIAAAHAISSRG